MKERSRETGKDRALLLRSRPSGMINLLMGDYMSESEENRNDMTFIT